MFVSTFIPKNIEQSNSKYHYVFFPFLFLRLENAENYFSDMEKKGWKVRRLILGNFIQFISCPSRYAQYYFTAEITYKGSYSFCKAALSSALQKHEEQYHLLSYGFYLLVYHFNLYRVEGYNTKIEQAKTNRTLDMKKVKLSLIITLFLWCLVMFAIICAIF